MSCPTSCGQVIIARTINHLSGVNPNTFDGEMDPQSGDKYSDDVDIGIMTRVGDSVRMTTS